MNTPAAELKKSLKVFAPVRTESYQIGEHGISAQDPDLWVVADSPLSGLGDCFSVNGKKLSQVVNRMGGQIEIAREEKLLTLKSAKAKVDLEIQNIKPLKIPETPGANTAVRLSEFKKTLSAATASVNTNKSTPYGGVVQVQSLPSGIEDEIAPGYRIIGTDGAVLTVAVVNDYAVSEFRFLLNLAAAGVVQLMDGDHMVFADTNAHIFLQVPGLRVFASKPSKVYPAFDALLAIPSKLKFSFKPEEWLAALKTVEPLIDDVDQGAIGLHFGEGVVQFSSIGIGSRAEDEAEYEQLDPDPIFQPVTVSNLKVSAKLLSGFLSKAGPEATMGLVEKSKPVRLESGNVTSLIMPMFVKKEAK